MAASKADATAEAAVKKEELEAKIADLEAKNAELTKRQNRFDKKLELNVNTRISTLEEEMSRIHRAELNLRDTARDHLDALWAEKWRDIEPQIRIIVRNELQGAVRDQVREYNNLMAMRAAPAAAMTTTVSPDSLPAASAPAVTIAPPAPGTPVDRSVVVFDYREKEAHMWNLPALPIPLVGRKNVDVLKLVVHGYAFYSIVRDGKCIDFRVGEWMRKLLSKNVYARVVIYHGYFEPHDRPYIVKEFMGAVVIENGVKISYPLMDVLFTLDVTYGIKLGSTLEYFNPHAVERQNKFLKTRLSGFILQPPQPAQPPTPQDTPTETQVDYIVRRIRDNKSVTDRSMDVLERALVDGSPVRAYTSPKVVRAFQERTGESLELEQVLERLKLDGA